MSDFMSALHGVVNKGALPRAERQADWLMEGRIIAVHAGSHTADFVIPEWSSDHNFLNRPYGDQISSPPNVGDTCLIAFVGKGIGRSWIVSWHTPD